jgi:hypothetical protein
MATQVQIKLDSPELRGALGTAIRDAHSDAVFYDRARKSSKSMHEFAQHVERGAALLAVAEGETVMLDRDAAQALGEWLTIAEGEYDQEAQDLLAESREQDGVIEHEQRSAAACRNLRAQLCDAGVDVPRTNGPVSDGDAEAEAETATPGTMPLSREDAGVVYRVMEGYMLDMGLQDVEERLNIDGTEPDLDGMEQLGDELGLVARVLRVIDKREYPVDQDARGLFDRLVEHAEGGHGDPLDEEDAALWKSRTLQMQQMRRALARRAEREAETASVA